MSSVCVLKLKVQFCMQRNRLEESVQILAFHVGGAKVSLWLCFCRKFVLQNVGGSEWVDPRNDLVLGSAKIGVGCMNLATVISRYSGYP